MQYCDEIVDWLFLVVLLLHCIFLWFKYITWSDELILSGYTYIYIYMLQPDLKEDLGLMLYIFMCWTNVRIGLGYFSRSISSWCSSFIKICSWAGQLNLPLWTLYAFILKKKHTMIYLLWLMLHMCRIWLSKWTCFQPIVDFGWADWALMATEQLLLVFSLYRLCVCSCFCVSSGASQK